MANASKSTVSVASPGKDAPKNTTPIRTLVNSTISGLVNTASRAPSNTAIGAPPSAAVQSANGAENGVTLLSSARRGGTGAGAGAGTALSAGMEIVSGGGAAPLHVPQLRWRESSVTNNDLDGDGGDNGGTSGANGGDNDAKVCGLQGV